MSENSTIEWTDSTWPVTTGCDDESPGCLNCYSKRDSHRLAGNPNPKVSAAYAGTTERREGGPIRWTGKLNLMHDRLGWPDGWKKPRRIFVGNMSDLFHPAVPDAYIEEVARTMRRANWHTFQVLTKRSARCRDMLRGGLRSFGEETHIWWGVSVEDRRHGLPRVDHLREAPACVRFLSVEPLLEDLGELDLRGIHWVIAGGESGPAHGPWSGSGWSRFASSASPRASPSSSSSGVVSGRRRPGGRSTAALTTRCLAAGGRTTTLRDAGTIRRSKARPLPIRPVQTLLDARGRTRSRASFGVVSPEEHRAGSRGPVLTGPGRPSHVTPHGTAVRRPG